MRNEYEQALCEIEILLAHNPNDPAFYNADKGYRLLRELAKKETPRKVTHEATIYSCCTCPNCLNVIDEFEDFFGQRVRVTFKYCRFCGQKLDWSDE